jgi:hypothetical protein
MSEELSSMSEESMEWKAPADNIDNKISQSSTSTEFSIEPQKFSSPFEAREKGRTEFLELLHSANTRTLVEYLFKAGVKIEKIDELPVAWKTHFKDKKFKNDTYTWRNPKLYFITKEEAAQFALAELLRRINDESISFDMAA